MAKTKKRSEVAAPAKDRLEQPLTWFRRGDYPRARAAFAEVVASPEATDAEREAARDLMAATRVDRATLAAGLTCLGIFAVAVTLTALVQP